MKIAGKPSHQFQSHLCYGATMTNCPKQPLLSSDHFSVLKIFLAFYTMIHGHISINHKNKNNFRIDETNTSPNFLLLFSQRHKPVMRIPSHFTYTTVGIL
jgi:hypothetical protein